MAGGAAAAVAGAAKARADLVKRASSDPDGRVVFQSVLFKGRWTARREATYTNWGEAVIAGVIVPPEEIDAQTEKRARQLIADYRRAPYQKIPAQVDRMVWLVARQPFYRALRAKSLAGFSQAEISNEFYYVITSGSPSLKAAAREFDPQRYAWEESRIIQIRNSQGGFFSTPEFGMFVGVVGAAFGGATLLAGSSGAGASAAAASSASSGASAAAGAGMGAGAAGASGFTGAMGASISSATGLSANAGMVVATGVQNFATNAVFTKVTGGTFNLRQSVLSAGVAGIGAGAGYAAEMGDAVSGATGLSATTSLQIATGAQNFVGNAIAGKVTGQTFNLKTAVMNAGAAALAVGDSQLPPEVQGLVDSAKSAKEVVDAAKAAQGAVAAYKANKDMKNKIAISQAQDAQALADMLQMNKELAAIQAESAALSGASAQKMQQGGAVSPGAQQASPAAAQKPQSVVVPVFGLGLLALLLL